MSAYSSTSEHNSVHVDVDIAVRNNQDYEHFDTREDDIDLARRATQRL